MSAQPDPRHHGTICLNVIRHAELLVPRGQETYDQFIDHGWRESIDDLNPVAAAPQIAAATVHLLRQPGRPLVIRHSPTMRARKTAALIRARLADRPPVYPEAALDEPRFAFSHVMTRAEYEAPERASTAVIFRLFRAIAEDDARIVPGGRAAVARQIDALRQIVDAETDTDHLWISHGPIMPFIHMGVVDGLPPEQWTLERARALGRYDYACGFTARLTAR